MIICETCNGNGYVRIGGHDPVSLTILRLTGDRGDFGIEQCATCDSKGVLTNDKKSMVTSET